MTMKRNVHFDETVQVRELPPSNSVVSCEEMESLWFSSEEIADMHSRDRQLARKISSNMNGPVFRIHGLQTRETRDQRRVFIREGRLLVLLEQENLWENDHKDPDRIARKYSAFTRSHTAAAHKRGLRNAEETKSFDSSRSPSSHVRKRVCVKRRLLLKNVEKRERHLPICGRFEEFRR
jgi:hypothetical protein